MADSSIVSESSASELATSATDATVATDNGNIGNRRQHTATVSCSKGSVEEDSLSPSKRSKLDVEVEQQRYDLEERLNNILSCTRCQDLPTPNVYQCNNGHLLCNCCLMELMADSRVRNSAATCPQCQCEVSRRLCTRNLVIEKTIAELPMSCPFCQKIMPRHELLYHKKEQCQKRPVQCKYSIIGCRWVGEFRMQEVHRTLCPYPEKKGWELANPIEQLDERKDMEMKVYKRLLGLLSYEEVVLIDFKLYPNRSANDQDEVLYESGQFTAHNLTWMIHARIGACTDPRTCHTARCLSYKLVLKTAPPPTRVQISYVIVRGPFGLADMEPALYDFRFSENDAETPFCDAPCRDPSDVNLFLGAKMINLRVALIHAKK